MKTEVDLQAGLRSLRESLRQMKALLAWLDLKAAELEPDHRPAFRAYDPTETDLRNEFSCFLASLATIHDSLDAHPKAASEAEKQHFTRELMKLKQEVQALNLHRRFWRS